jgi:tRNA(His) 5'-end guanylyltransferase
MIDKMGDRLKMFEGIEAGRILIPNLPICVRVDGRAFHTFTRGMNRPYDERMSKAMIETMKYLVKKTDACVGYVQSDEISLVLSDSKEPLFGGRVQKLTSIIAAMATAKFNDEIHKSFPDKPLAEFDCRVWNVPNRTEAANTILWREFDATKNSISMAARSVYSDNQLLNKNSSEKQELLWQKGINWDKYPVFFKRGTYARRVVIERKLTPDEMKDLPEHHEARKNPDMVFTRSEIKEIEMPIFSTVENREAVIFEGAEPKVK